MYQPNTFCIDKSGYNEYIRSKSPKQLNKIIDELDDEEAIYGYTIGFSNSRQCHYDSLWIIDAGKEYIPVLIQNINTSSYFAMWCCGIYQDEDEENQIEWSFEDLIEFVGEGWRKTLRKVIQEDYIDKEINKN